MASSPAHPAGPRLPCSGTEPSRAPRPVFAIPHVRALACPGAHYAKGSVPRWDEGGLPRPSKADVIVRLPAPSLRRWHPDPEIRDHPLDPSWPQWAPPMATPWIDVVQSNLSQEPLLGVHALRDKRPWLQTPLNLSAPSPTAQLVQTRVGRGSRDHCPSLPKYWLPRGARRGACRPAPPSIKLDNDCARGHHGTFEMFASARRWRSSLHALNDCARSCLLCPRCRFITLVLTPPGHVCEWHHACNLNVTHTLRSGHAAVSVAIDDVVRYSRLCLRRFGASNCPTVGCAPCAPRARGVSLAKRIAWTRRCTPEEDATLTIAPQNGYCTETTAGEHSCDGTHPDSSGVWPGVGSLRGCLVACLSCAACRFISWSPATLECAWYTACNTAALKTAGRWVDGVRTHEEGMSYTTVEVVRRNSQT